MDVPLGLAAVILLVAANGFFVATEFALVSVRRTRIEQLAASGNTAARSVLDAVQHLDAYIAATQLGITMASLALGWVGEPALAHLIEPIVLVIPFVPPDMRSLASHGVSATIAFVVITALHIVIGELAPKSIALQRAEQTALFVTGPIHVFLAVFRLPIFVLNSIGNAVVRVFGIQPAAGHELVQSAEELKLSVAASREAGLVTESAHEVVDRALDFTQLTAHQVMVPRTEIVALDVGVSTETLVAVVGRHQHSRYPVYEHTLDNVVGVASAKRLLTAVADSARSAQPFDLRQHVDTPLFVPERMTAYRLMEQMKRERNHSAVVLDEYGVTAGFVTLRDLMDRLVGELPDEAEMGPRDIEWQPDGSAAVDGLTLLGDLEEELGVQLADEENDTVGGFVFGLIGRRPALGDTVQADGLTFTVEDLDGLRISRVRVRRGADDDDTAQIPPAFLRDVPG